MPNRIIRESICKSSSIDELSWFEEVFFYRLSVNCDDYGRCDARPKLLKAELFPLKDCVSIAQVQKTLLKLNSLAMIQLYEFEGKAYLQLTNWHKYQSVRNKRSKYPSPLDGLYENDQDETALPSLESNCMQMKENVPVIQSLSESVSESVSEKDTVGAACEASPRGILEMELNDHSHFCVTNELVGEWHELYPAVDILAEVRKMQGWLVANPKKRKTSAGILRFIHSWLAKAQDRGGIKDTNYVQQNAYKPAYKNRFRNYEGHVYDWDNLEKLEAEYLVHSLKEKPK